jgi:hypothetical protein
LPFLLNNHLGDIMNATSLPALSCPELTPEQIAKASRHLIQTRDALLESVAGLSAAQWEFKPAPDRWSVAEILEHIILVETAILQNVRATMDAPLAPPEWEPSQANQICGSPGSAEVYRATTAMPDWAMEHDGSGAIFLDRREQNLQMLTPGLLRGRVIPHPALGPWDGYQWLLAAGSHCSRHTAQICEVKDEPGFPSTTGVTSELAVH